MQPIILGEGGYGCVHSPSLKCRHGKKVSYNNKVSKTLRKKHAKVELAEYHDIQRMDPDHRFFLGSPQSCEIDNHNGSNLLAIRECDLGEAAIKRLSDYQLLIMRNGGINLEKMILNLRKTKPTKETTIQCHLFLLETTRLFQGLCVFLDHGFLLQDVKPQNLVYNEKQNRLNFIDFGLMVKYETFVDEAKHSRRNFDTIHWSYPWENEFLNKNVFVKYSKNPKLCQKRWDVLVRSIIQQDEFHEANQKDIQHISSYLEHVLDSSLGEDKYNIQIADIMNNYKTFLIREFSNLTHHQFLQKSAKTFDSFSLGFTMVYYLFATRKHIGDAKIWSSLLEIAHSMCNLNPMARMDIDTAKHAWLGVLLASGWIDKYDYELDDSIAVPTTTKNKDKQHASMIPRVKNKFISNPNILEEKPGSVRWTRRRKNDVIVVKPKHAAISIKERALRFPVGFAF